MRFRRVFSRMPREALSGVARPPGGARWLAWAAAAVAAAFLVGYLAAALLIFPAPLLVGRTAVPRVIGLPAAEARGELERVGLLGADGGREPHDGIPSGHVTWQDPPPGLVVPERATVALVTSSGPAAAVMPDVTGLDAQLATRLVEAAGLKVRALDSVQAPLPRGVAVLSRPRAGTALAPGTGVVLTVSRGEATITVPAVTGLSLGDARAALEAAGLRVGSAWSRSESGAIPGTVVEQRPAAGTLAAPESSVDVILARRRSR